VKTGQSFYVKFVLFLKQIGGSNKSRFVSNSISGIVQFYKRSSYRHEPIKQNINLTHSLFNPYNNRKCIELIKSLNIKPAIVIGRSEVLRRKFVC